MTDYFNINMPEKEIKSISNLGLAHLGDGVFELMVRSWLIEQGKATSKGLHNAAVTYVSAPAQAEAMKKILPVLTEKEQEIYRRGKNAHVNSVPTKSTAAQYHAATGLEALFGYLYLEGATDRLNELFKLMMGE